MSREFLAGRERALEDEFFYQVDQKLKQQLQATIEAEQNREQLAAETGISDPALLEELVQLGITTQTLLALSLFPLVQVAWADRIIEEKERNAVLAAAEKRGYGRDSAGYRLLEHWLNVEPHAKVATAWKDYVSALCAMMSTERRAAMRDVLIENAREVAAAAGGILGIGSVSQKEEAVLEELKQAFDVGSSE